MSTTMSLTPPTGTFDNTKIGELASSIISLLENATREVETDREAAKSFIAKASSLLQVQVDRGEGPATDATSGGLAPWKIRRVKAHIEAHLSRTLSVAELSALAGLSTTHFSRAFGRSFGEAPHVYVVRRRLDRARLLMLTTDLALSEVAIACGFSDQAHFCKLFRRHIGRTPAAWRRERRDAAMPIRMSAAA